MDGFIDAYVRLRSKTTDEWFVHPELRSRLVADARAQGTNMTAVAVKILCDEYGVPYSGSARKTEPRSDDDKIVLRLPVDLNAAIRRRHRLWQDGLRGSLCRHYGLDVPARAPRTRRSRAAAA